MKVIFYLDLVKFFYTCASANMEGNLYSIVNGVEMIIDAAVWKAVAGLNIVGVCTFKESTNGHSKMQTYKGMLLDPIRNLRNCLGVSGLTIEDRMFVYLIT